MPQDMRRPYHLILATAILASPLPVAAQVTIDPNALNALGRSSLPEPPPAAAPAGHRSHRYRSRHLARSERAHRHGAATAIASNPPATTPNAPTSNATAPGAVALEHPKNLGPSFTSLPPLPQVPPPLPAPPPVVTAAAPKVKPAAPKPVETAQAAPSPAPQPAAPKPVAKVAASAPPPPTTAVPPQLALPAAVPPPARLAEATPGPPAAGPPVAAGTASPAPAPANAPDALPKGADLLTLPFFVQDSDLPPAETAMLRDFTQRHGADTQYIVRAYASAPPGDDDPSTPRRIALARAQSVASALFDSGAQPDAVRLLALGDAGGSPPNRVEVIAMPPPSGHTASQSSP
jgi:hypothetical protein